MAAIVIVFLFLFVIFLYSFLSCGSSMCSWAYLFDAGWHCFSVEQYFSKTLVQDVVWVVYWRNESLVAATFYWRSLMISWETCHFTLYLSDFSQWFRVAGLEMDLQEMHHTQPTLLWFFSCGSWALLSLMESCGRSTGNRSCSLIALSCCLESTTVIGSVISHNSCFCIAMHLKLLIPNSLGKIKTWLS